MASHTVLKCALILVALLFVLPVAWSHTIYMMDHTLTTMHKGCLVSVTETISYRFDSSTTNLKRILNLNKGVDINVDSLTSPEGDAKLDKQDVEAGGNTYAIEWSFSQQAAGALKNFTLIYTVNELVRINGSTDNAFAWTVVSDKEGHFVENLRVNAIFLFKVEEVDLKTVPVFDNFTSTSDTETHVEWEEWGIGNTTSWTLSENPFQNAWIHIHLSKKSIETFFFCCFTDVSFPKSDADLGDCLGFDEIRGQEPPIWLAILVLATVLVILAVIVIAIVIAVVSQIMHNRSISGHASPVTTTSTTAARSASIHAIDTNTGATADVFDPTATPLQPQAAAQAI